VYDPVANDWTDMPPLQGRYNHTATMMANGMVLIVGGQTTSGIPSPSAVRFDPSSYSWVATAAVPGGFRVGHRAVLLATGRVLIPGGGPLPSLLYDPNTDGWSTTGGLNVYRTGLMVLALGSGRILAAGGSDASSGAIANTAELYDVASGLWTLS